MKKLFLSVLFLMISLVSYSQTFVEKYNSAISKKADVFGDWQDVSLTVVFNEKASRLMDTTIEATSIHL